MTTTIRSIAAALALLPFLTQASAPETNASVTVWFEGSDVATGNGQQSQRVKTIPLIKGLTIAGAISCAGGYTTPPYRNIFFIRDGRSIRVTEKQLLKPDGDIPLKPGDRIELKF